MLGKPCRDACQTEDVAAGERDGRVAGFVVFSREVEDGDPDWFRRRIPDLDG